jgi:hypothetical protein
MNTRMRWAGNVVRKEDRKGAYRVLVSKPEEKRPLGNLAVDGRIILILIFLNCPEFLHIRHMKVTKLAVICIDRLYPLTPPPAVDPAGPSEVERIKSVKNPSNSTGNRNYDLPACSAVPQPTAP